MSKMILKQLANHLLIGAVSVAITLVAFEGILALALVESKNTTIEEVDIVDVPSQESKSAPVVTITEIKESQGSSCNSDYYAVFDLPSGTSCVQNPTLLMAHWGPPSNAWFRSLGGKISTQNVKSISVSQCACLAKQPEYQLTSNSAGTPASHIQIGNTQIPITKWVCGDPCAATKGKAYEY